MTGEIFRNWIQAFIRDEKISPSSPALLILDSHRSREDLQALEYAATHGLTILTFPGKATHLLQPLDVSLFGPFKKKYQEIFHRQEKKMIQPSIEDVVPFIKEALHETFTSSNIKQAFRAAGLWPLDKKKVLENQKTPSVQPAQVSVEKMKKVFENVPLVIEVQKAKKTSGVRFSIANGIVTGQDLRAKIRDRVEKKEKEKVEKEARKVAREKKASEKNEGKKEPKSRKSKSDPKNSSQEGQ